MGRIVCGEQRKDAKLKENNVIWIRDHYIKGDKEYGQSALAKKFGVSRRTIELIVKRKVWRHIK